MKTVMKLLAALAAIVGAVYVIATYGEKIVAWAKKLLGCCECECGECECGECECGGDCKCEEEDVAEEEVVEEAPVEETAVEEVVVEENEPVAEETDFEA